MFEWHQLPKRQMYTFVAKLDLNIGTECLSLFELLNDFTVKLIDC